MCVRVVHQGVGGGEIAWLLDSYRAYNATTPLSQAKPSSTAASITSRHKQPTPHATSSCAKLQANDEGCATTNATRDQAGGEGSIIIAAVPRPTISAPSLQTLYEIVQERWWEGPTIIAALPQQPLHEIKRAGTDRSASRLCHDDLCSVRTNAIRDRAREMVGGICHHRCFATTNALRD